ncbi:MAG: GIY-YIG nuclease family protein [Vicinamibacterales bacterium]
MPAVLRRLLQQGFGWLVPPADLDTAVARYLAGDLPPVYLDPRLPRGVALRGPWFGDQVYFVQVAEPRRVGAVKIGISNNPLRRLASLQQSVPYPLRLLATVPDLLLPERVLHGAFGRFRIQGEWFRPVPSLLATTQVLARLAAIYTGPVARVEVDWGPLAGPFLPAGEVFSKERRHTWLASDAGRFAGRGLRCQAQVWATSAHRRQCFAVATEEVGGHYVCWRHAQSVRNGKPTLLTARTVGLGEVAA